MQLKHIPLANEKETKVRLHQLCNIIYSSISSVCSFYLPFVFSNIGNLIYLVMFCLMQPGFMSLRELCSNYIRTHRDDFLPFIEAETENDTDSIDFNEYVNKIICAEDKDVVWGGHTEIVALAQALNVQIQVHTGSTNNT